MKPKEIIFKILRWGGLAVLLWLILIVVFGFAEKTYTDWYRDMNPRYEWQAENGEEKYEEKYKDVVWNKIIEERLNGFTYLGDVVVENKVTCYWSNEPCYSLIFEDGEYLRVEGGLVSSYYYLIVTKNRETQIVKSLEELKKFFAPVDNEVEAMSFIAVTERGLKWSKKDTLAGETAVIDDGYLVKVVKNNTFGCGRHDPQRVIFKITKAGEIIIIAVEILPPLSGYEACVD